MSNIQMVNLKRQYKRYKDEFDAALFSVIEDSAFVLGKYVSDFEEQCKDYLKAEYTLGVANGTDALTIGLMALGIKPGDEVITTPFTFVATTETIMQVGATPVYVDIDPVTFNIDPAKIEEKITEKTKAILPVHLYGLPAEMDEINAIAKKHNLKVLEDCAQAFGSNYKGKKACTLSDGGTVSFFPGKNLGAFGDGGMVVLKDEEAYNIAAELRNHGGVRKYEHVRLGFNSRLDAIHAAVLSVKLKYYDEWNQKRAELANEYRKQLAGLELVTPALPENRTHIYHQFTVRTAGRNELAEYLGKNNIPCGVHYAKTIVELDAVKPLGNKLEDYPNAIKAAQEVLSLPMCPELTMEEANVVTDCIKKFFNN